ncbi:cytochrome C oxidase subunit II [Raphidocelis subcapitata]|uniref:Cytochrome C oxidase subunit II n=1 Tax=Raphidocelis subcapitata TaxID=307507 RepID=A0A2V0PQ22_9CHLO|nr:cytochrome C oxidase subunit II [Raphidocelis subcapitata]|eukprot:GBG00284.1 cytochrome C oxidase subunit II [Raphidocelis subcapitata]
MQPEPWCWEASARAEAVLLSAPPSGGEVPLVPVHTAGGWDAALLALPPSARRWAEESGAKVAKSGDTFAVPSDEGRIAGVIVGLDSPTDVWGWAAAAGKLPGGGSKDGSGGEGGGAVYALDTAALEAFARGGVADAADAAALGWMLGSYKFDRYKTAKQGGKERGAAGARLVCPEAADRRRAVALARAHYFARDLINTPANDLGPEHLAREAVALAAAHEGAECSVVSGEGLLEAGYPAIHTVGRASTRPPALIDITWRPPGAGAASLPAVALVGKGVCFDTGGLNLKTAAGMKARRRDCTMKKDMGGAALVLAVAHAVMSLRLPLALRVLVPAVENSVAGDAYRPLDVLDTRAGMTIEQGNCDAEGRLILADALFEAATARPDLIIDAATLTGAARAALGPELPAVFSSDDAAWRELERAAAEQNDPLWRLPLHRGYRRLLDSKVADIGSVASDGAGQGGAIVAALFLWEFVAAGARASAAPGAGGSGGAAAGPSDAAAPPPPWLHIDTGAWVGGARPGRPDGGEALGLLALVAMLRARYGGGGAAGGGGGGDGGGSGEGGPAAA